MKNEIMIVRITEVEKRMIEELRRIHSVNISNLVREMIKIYYNSRKTYDSKNRVLEP